MIDSGVKLRSGYDLAKRLLVGMLLALVLGYVGYLALALGPDFWRLTLTSFVRGEERILEPAELRGRALRGPGDRVYLLTTQSERVVPLRWTRRSGMRLARQALHVDLWAFDAATAALVWKSRVRTFEDQGSLMHELLGLDGGVLWLHVREPIGVSVTDGTIVADTARLTTINPALAGTLVDAPGFVAFGGQGLQITLTDSTQWVVDDTLHAERRETAPKTRPSLVMPGPEGAATDRFQLRGLPIGETRWLGVFTDEEAAALQADPVIPGRDPNEPRGALYDFYASQHVPTDLHGPAARPYRLWGAKVAKVSAAPRDWPKDFPNKWGTRDEFSAYQVLPEAPAFLRAGLLGDGRSKYPFWVRDPDGVLVLHHDKLGPTGRLHVTRVSGPVGKVAWDAALPIDETEAVLFAPDPTTTASIVFVGTEPNPTHDPRSEVSREVHQKVVALSVASGAVATYDLTARSVAGSAVVD